MNLKAIQKTAVCSFDPKEGLFTVSSPLLEVAWGISEDEQEACQIFDDMAKDLYMDYLDGRGPVQYAKRGRPRKNRVVLNVQVKPDTLTSIREMSQAIEMSQGEVVDYLLAYYQASESIKKKEQRELARQKKTRAAAKIATEKSKSARNR